MYIKLKNEAENYERLFKKRLQTPEHYCLQSHTQKMKSTQNNLNNKLIPFVLLMEN